ncbi:MAG: hypothetical protein FJ276_09900, partial [Planctomycetes bacterium]|nr:hypothetical protein [Planctomycetota bacterium]
MAPVAPASCAACVRDGRDRRQPFSIGGRSMRWHVHLCGCFVLSTAPGVLAQPPDANLPPPVPEGVTDDADLDVLTRGPVHEAFAEQINRDPSAGIVVPKAPPEPVAEIPPDAKPEGDDVAWISGYWFWDKDRNDFVWVSGVWRRIPPGRRWVPGYWQAESGGYQWVAGFWAAAERSELEYLDAPPASLEVGPASPAPSVDHFWIPGCWISTAGSYSWRPGYWSAYRVDWTWITARYAWTPRGCIYVSGYWDHPWSRRGCLFAPIYFRRPVYLQVGYNYRPAWCIEYNTLLLHLFVRPTYHHYYFGDYYGPEYHRDYYYACRAYGGSQSWYDPFCVYYQHL